MISAYFVGLTFRSLARNHNLPQLSRTVSETIIDEIRKLFPRAVFSPFTLRRFQIPTGWTQQTRMIVLDWPISQNSVSETLSALALVDVRLADGIIR